MSGSDWEALPDIRQWSRDPLGCPGEVGRPSRMSVSGLEALQDDGSGREALPDDGSGREALPVVREWLGGPPGCPRVVGSLSRVSGSRWEALLDVRE